MKHLYSIAASICPVNSGHEPDKCPQRRLVATATPRLPYLLTRAADLGNHSRTAYVVAMLFVAMIFGFGYFYKGPEGIMDSTYSGLVLGGVYLLSGRNLWTAILAHGITETIAVLVVLMGWAT